MLASFCSNFLATLRISKFPGPSRQSARLSKQAMILLQEMAELLVYSITDIAILGGLNKAQSKLKRICLFNVLFHHYRSFSLFQLARCDIPSRFYTTSFFSPLVRTSGHKIRSSGFYLFVLMDKTHFINTFFKFIFCTNCIGFMVINKQ